MWWHVIIKRGYPKTYISVVLNSHHSFIQCVVLYKRHHTYRREHVQGKALGTDGGLHNYTEVPLSGPSLTSAAFGIGKGPLKRLNRPLCFLSLSVARRQWPVLAFKFYFCSYNQLLEISFNWQGQLLQFGSHTQCTWRRGGTLINLANNMKKIHIGDSLTKTVI